MKLPVVFKIIYRSRVLRTAAICLVVGANFVVLGLGAGLSKSEWANWVQAVGSIAALLGAFVIATKQHKDGIERDHIATTQRKHDRDESVKLVIAHCFSVIFGLPGRREGPEDFETYVRAVPRVTFSNLQTLLAGAPLYEVTDKSVVRTAMDMSDLLHRTIALLQLINGLSPDERAESWDSISMRIEHCRQMAWAIHQNLKLQHA